MLGIISLGPVIFVITNDEPSFNCFVEGFEFLPILFAMPPVTADCFIFDGDNSLVGLSSWPHDGFESMTNPGIDHLVVKTA